MGKKVRSSNFELLRIVAMILIILFHIQYHGPQVHLNDGYFAYPMIYKRLFIFEIGNSLGMIGNGLFLMLSGYFLVNSKNMDLGKISKKLLLEVGFAAIVLTVASSIIITYTAHNYGSLILVGMNLFNDSWWFVGYYLLVVVAAKLFLNDFLQKFDQKQYSAFILTFFAIVQFQWSGCIFEGITGGLRTLLIGLFLYSLGGYISKYDPFKNVRFFSLILIIAATYAIRFASSYNTNMQNIETLLANYTATGVQTAYNPIISGFCNFEITVIILAVTIFEIFKRIHIPNNKIINYLGKSTLMIYFIHENELFINYYKNDNWMEPLVNSNLGIDYIIMWLYWTGIAFIVGETVYTVYVLLGKLAPRIKYVFVKKSDVNN